MGRAAIGCLSLAAFLTAASPLAFAETCREQVRECFGGLQSAACQSDCDGECWSTANGCTHIASIPVDGHCGCVDPDATCQVAHGRAMAKLYRLTVRAHKRCFKRVGGAGTGCPDGEALATITRARRAAERRARRACGETTSGQRYVGLGDELMRCVRSADEPLVCRSVIARQSLRHAIVVARSQAACLKDTLASIGGFRICPRGAAMDAIVRSLNRFSKRISTACGAALVATPGTCELSLCDRVADGIDYRVDLCAQCCTDQTAFAAVAAAFGDVPAHCGDGLVSAGESCDDGGESVFCNADCTATECGDGVVNSTAGEECDDRGESVVCDVDCTFSVCGDGVHNGRFGEQCDDGGDSALCDSNCTPAECGDGYTNASAGEDCDDGVESAGCDGDCTLPMCGDGVANTQADEGCDDGNTVAGDGCNEECEIESGPHDPECPNVEELFFYGRVYGMCTTNADCPVGDCDSVLGRCRSATDFDRGWTGISHDQDWNHGQVRRLQLHCPLDELPGCGACDVVGLAPMPGQCRCEHDSRSHCDEAFGADFDDCGGAECRCYAGPPVPFSAGNTPGCILERYFEQPSGVVDVDSGTREIHVDTRTLTFVGETLVTPCPYCDGDLFAADGARDGVCVGGDNDGLACDADARNESFPAPAGAGASLDCFPSAGKNSSGVGMKLTWDETTDLAVLEARMEWPCGFTLAPFFNCHCGLCDNAPDLPCNADEDCPRGGRCGVRPNGGALPNQCRPTESGLVCLPGPDGEGICEEGPDDRFCDGILRADGGAIVACVTNLDCEPGAIGIDAGRCAISRRRKCFEDSIQRAGRADPGNPILAAATCLGQESSAGKNAVHGQPGPAARTLEASATFRCATDPSVAYRPGVGGCPSEPAAAAPIPRTASSPASRSRAETWARPRP